MGRYIIVLAFTILCSIFTSVAEQITVTTDLGRIIGNVKTLTINEDVVRIKKFLGIPYAKPPIGELRFSKPEPAEKFTGDYEATEFGAACLQPPTDAFREFTKLSEDCLYLNIYVPDHLADKETGHAVMVFIHGGGFQHGAGESYPGENLATNGNVIVVTLNYRLNIFGFLSTGDEIFPGNFGLWDQHMALQWVRKHIKAFGGDDERVTVFGESAGASSALFQGLLPQNKGLLQRVISQSGAPSLALTMNAMPKEQFYFLAQIFGCLSGSPSDTISCMKQKDAQSIMMALHGVIMDIAKQKEPDMSKLLALFFFPTPDGDFFEVSPPELYKRSRSEQLKSVGYFRTLDVLIGHNSQEGSLMLYNSMFYPTPDMDNFLPSRENLTTGMIDAVMTHEFGIAPVHNVIKSMFVSEFTDWSDPYSPESIRQQYVSMMGNVAFEKPTIEFMRIHANSSSSANGYAYVFDSVPTTRLLATPKWASGANHGDELGFVFGFMDKLLEDFKRKPAQPMDWEWELSKQMQTLWSNFAKTGNPNEPVQSSPKWPQFDMTKQQCLKLQHDATGSKTVAIPFCNARRSNFLLDVVPTVMSALNSVHDESSPFLHSPSDTCDTEGNCG